MFVRPLERAPFEQSGHESKMTSLSLSDPRFLEIAWKIQKPEAFGQMSLLEDTVEIIPVTAD